jgi:SAM-dependent methyltransferase
MQQIENWRASKFIPGSKPGQWRPNPAHVYPGSWFILSVYIDLYVEVIQRYTRGHLLDLGAGMVPFYGIYCDQISASTCIDWANSLHSNPHLDLVADLNQIFPLPDNTYDTILCSDVLEHIADPFAFMRETARVLQPGGDLLLMVPFFYWLHETPHDYYRYTEFALRKICADNKLEVIELKAYGGYLDVLLDLLSKGLGRSRMASRCFFPLAKWVASRAFNRKIRRSTAARFPLGYVLVARKRV